MRARQVSDARGFTLIELLIVVALIGIVSAIAIANLLRAKSAANEASAIGTLRAIVSGQASYASTCGRGHYSRSLTELVTDNYLNPDADVTPKSGFMFALDSAASVAGPTSCNGLETRSGYYVRATPVSTLTGRRGFATSAAGTIWQNQTGIAPAEPFGADGSETLREH